MTSAKWCPHAEGRKHPTRSHCCLRLQSGATGLAQIGQLLEASRRGCDLVGPKNDRVIYEAVSKADLVVVAWNDVLQHRADEVWGLIRPLGKDPDALERMEAAPQDCPEGTVHK